MTILAVLGIVIALATLVFAALQFVFTLHLAKTESHEQQRHKLLGYRWFWRSVAVTFATIVGIFAFPAVQSMVLVPTADQSQLPSVSPLYRDKQPPAKPRTLAQSRSPKSNVSAIAGTLIKRMIRDSRAYQYLTIYGDTQHLDFQNIDQYWVPGGDAAQAVVAIGQRLQEFGWHIGAGAKLVTVEFRYIRILDNRAEVGTNEYWYLPLFDKSESRTREREAEFGPLYVDYVLSETGGRWLVLSTTDPYLRELN